MTVPLIIKVFRLGKLVTTQQFEHDLIRIGRVVDADLYLLDGRLGRVHCVIKTAADGSLSIEDRGSTNGTFINGQRIKTAPLFLGDEILLGDFTLRLERPAIRQGVL